MKTDRNIMAWDPEIVPQSSGDPETDATPETLLYIARDVWRLFAPDPSRVAALGKLSRAQRADILFWLGPLESLVRCILFLLLPDDLLGKPPEDDRTGQGAAPPAPPPTTPPHPRAAPSSLPTETAPAFRYWKVKRRAPELVFDFAEPGAAAAFAAFLAARRARCAVAAARPPSPGDFAAAPTARRMSALLGVLNDPLTHVDRLAARMRRRRPPIGFAAPRPKRLVSGPRAPCAHALERARNALCRLLDPLIGPPLPYWSSG